MDLPLPSSFLGSSAVPLSQVAVSACFEACRQFSPQEVHRSSLVSEASNIGDVHECSLRLLLGWLLPVLLLIRAFLTRISGSVSNQGPHTRGLAAKHLETATGESEMAEELRKEKE